MPESAERKRTVRRGRLRVLPVASSRKWEAAANPVPSPFGECRGCPHPAAARRGRCTRPRAAGGRRSAPLRIRMAKSIFRVPARGVSPPGKTRSPAEKEPVPRKQAGGSCCWPRSGIRLLVVGQVHRASWRQVSPIGQEFSSLRPFLSANEVTECSFCARMDNVRPIFRPYGKHFWRDLACQRRGRLVQSTVGKDDTG